ncbi:MAG TPA: response regulator [Planctomycetota bacterium]
MATKKRVLVCEDDPVQLAILSAAIRQAGYETATARTPEEGVKRALGAPVDAVVTDVRLLRGSAFDLVDALRRAGKDAPTLMLTGSATPFVKERAIQVGARGLLEKPCDIPSIVRVVRGLLSAPAAPEETRPILVSRPEIVGRAEAAVPESLPEPVRRVGILAALPEAPAPRWRIKATVWAAALMLALAGVVGIVEVL